MEQGAGPMDGGGGKKRRPKARAEGGSNRPESRKAAGKNKEAQAGESIHYVGIGASAGGLEALRPFVAALIPNGSNVYIVAQHMSPDHKSLMVELLARETGLRVAEATNNLVPSPDTIYVAPPNADVTVSSGRLRISNPINTIGPKPSVDRFFISLAEDQEDMAIGIVLSGTGSDGARGIKAIKAAGGITIAQDPKTAKYDSMPLAALRAGGADLSLPPQEIAEQLAAIVLRPRPFIPDAVEPPASNVPAILRQVAAHTGTDFSNYKDATISRQILRRMAALQIRDLDAYAEHISLHKDELAELASNFLICVTSFFRDPEAFESLRTAVREILAKKQPGDEIRIWAPGCATGEEVYSLAILLSEELGGKREQYKIQIFATDINDDAIAAGRAGVFPEAALSGLPGDLVERYFMAKDGQYRVDPSLRDLILFARHDLVQDPPFVRLDLVSCRNLLIYFKPDLQERVMKVFHYSLRPHALLFLGKSESVGRLGGIFSEKDRRAKIFQRRPGASPSSGSAPRPRADKLESVLAGAGKAAADPTPGEAARKRLLELFSPVGFLMTPGGDILEFFGDCGEFLRFSGGRPDFNAFGLIRSELRAELKAFAHRAARNGGSSWSSLVKCTPPRAADAKADAKTGGENPGPAGGENPRPAGGGEFLMSVHGVETTGSDGQGLVLVCFEPGIGRPKSEEASDGDFAAAAQERIRALEQDAVLGRENLQAVIEELETANEEMQSLNEEMQASNEELQATNEELETANEEMQATNEELVTVNDELGARTGELGEANADLTNVLESLRKGLLVIDRSLMITRWNRAALEFFEIPPEGRHCLTTIPTRFTTAEMLPKIASVLRTGEAEEIEVTRQDGKYFSLRVAPYLDPFGAGWSSNPNRRKPPSGAVLTIQDITGRKIAEDKLKLSASVFEHASEATVITDAHNLILSVNKAFTEITGWSTAEVIGKNPNLLNSGAHPKEFFTDMWRSLQRTGNWQGEIQNRRKDGEIYTEWLSIHVLRNDDGEIDRHIAVFSDITDAKKAQETIERQATYDALTGLPNRALTLDRLDHMLAVSRRRGRQFAVMFMDLDHFKMVNDALGHAAGDELLVKASERIQGALRDSDSVGRMGGDEFIVLLDDLSCAEDAAPIASKIISELGRPISVAGHAVQTGASIGVTVYPMDGDSAEALLKNSDSAMYEAKKNGRNTFCFFTSRMQDDANRRHWIGTELGAAILSGSLTSHYQPVFRLDTQEIYGAEALMRWNHPTKGGIPPDVFIPVAEQNGMIGEIGRRIVERGIEDWSRSGAEDAGLSLAFNVSAAQFVAKDKREALVGILVGSRLAKERRLVVEITESIKLSDNEDYLSTLNELRAAGCRIAIDDFGTGYSSLSYLKRMPIDIIKIDRSFVRDIATDAADAATVKAILQMAKIFGMKVVAEGVETQEQADFLLENGCDYAQGFLYAKPMAIEEIQDKFLGGGGKARS